MGDSESLRTKIKRIADQNSWSYLVAFNWVIRGDGNVTKKEKVDAFQLCKEDYEPSQRNAVWNFV